MREFGHHSRLDCFEDQLLVLADQSAKFCKFGFVHFLYHSLGTMLLLYQLGVSLETYCTSADREFHPFGKEHPFMTSTKYIGMDVHKESISIAVMNSVGKVVMECVIATN